MSTTTAPATTAPPRRRSPSEIALWVLGIAVLAAAPGLVAGLLVAAVWALTQAWIVIPALVIVALRQWRPKSFLAAALIGRQYVVQRQTKTA